MNGGKKNKPKGEHGGGRKEGRGHTELIINKIVECMAIARVNEFSIVGRQLL